MKRRIGLGHVLVRPSHLELVTTVSELFSSGVTDAKNPKQKKQTKNKIKQTAITTTTTTTMQKEKIKDKKKFSFFTPKWKS